MSDTTVYRTDYDVVNASPPTIDVDVKRTKAIEAFLFNSLLSIWKSIVIATPEQAEQVPEMIECLTVHQRHHQAIITKLWSKLITIEAEKDLPLKETHLHSWMHTNVGTISACRKTILRLTIKAATEGPATTQLYQELIVKCFKDAKVGSLNEANSSVADYANMRDACTSVLDDSALIVLFDVFRGATDEEFETVVKYFGADYIVPLTHAGFWASFTSMKSLITYIKEDTNGPLMTRNSRTTAMKVRPSKNALYKALMESMNPEFREVEGFTRLDSLDVLPYETDIMQLFDKLKDLQTSPGDAKAKRTALTERAIVWKEDGDNTRFREYAVELVEVLREATFASEPALYWNNFHKQMVSNFGNIDDVNNKLVLTEIVDHVTAEKFLKVVHKWNKKQDESSSSKSIYSVSQVPTASSSSDTVEEPLIDRIKKQFDQVYESNATSSSYDVERALKASYLEKLKRDGRCSICSFLGTYKEELGRKSKHYFHTPESCRYAKIFIPAKGWDQMILKGDANYVMLTKMEDLFSRVTKPVNRPRPTSSAAPPPPPAKKAKKNHPNKGGKNQKDK